MADRFSISSGARGSITIMNAWAGAPRGPGASAPYRDERADLVCTLCGASIATCAMCGRRFQSGQPIAADGCVELRVKTPAPHPPRPWWRRLLEALRVLDVFIDPIPEETEWVAVANWPHRCRNCNGERT